MFKDLGLSAATIQQKDITHKQISTLFWVNVGWGMLLAAAVAALSPAIARFYGEPRLVKIVSVFALIFVVGGLAVQHQALLIRRMRFLILAIINTLGLAAGAVAAILAALLGAGVWSLVLMHALSALVITAGVWAAAGWRPKRPARHCHVQEMLSLGGYLAAFNIVNYITRNLDNVLIGWRWGGKDLGYYSRAYSLLLMPINQVTAPLTNVAVVTLSKLRDAPSRYKAYYCGAMNVVAHLTVPSIAVLLVMSKEVVLLVLGRQWLPAVAIFRVLAVAALLQPFYNTTGWIFISLGDTARMFRAGTVTALLFGLAFLAGLSWGALGVAVAYTVAFYLIVPAYLWYALRRSPVTWLDLAAHVWRPFVAALVLGIVMAAGRRMVIVGTWASISAVPLLSVVITYAALILLWRGFRREIKGIYQLVRMFVGSIHEKAG